MKIVLASDHAGFQLKNHLVEILRAGGHEVLDRGTNSADSCDYPVFAHAAAADLAAGNAERAILVCSTGIGISIAANRHAGVRAAVCNNEDAAEFCRRHNDANALCLGAKYVTPAMAEKYVRLFLETSFEGGRHARRVGSIELKNICFASA